MQSIKPTKGKNKTNHDREEPRLQVLGEGGGKRFYLFIYFFKADQKSIKPKHIHVFVS